MTQLRKPLFVFILAVWPFLAAAPAAAHAGFDWSTPSDGGSVRGPVDEIRVAFTGPAEPTGSGFEVLDSSGTLRAPRSAESVDGEVWLLEFEPALPEGETGVRWMVAAPDAHPIEGSFSFTIEGSAEQPQELAAPPATATLAGALPQSNESLSEFLEGGPSTLGAERLAGVGRGASFVGALIGIGALVFAATVLRGSRGDISHVIYWVRRLGLVVSIGALVELVGQVGLTAGGPWIEALKPTTIGSAIWSQTGVAIGLRAMGGYLLAFGPQIAVRPASAVTDSVTAIREMVGVGVHVLGGAPEPAPRNLVDPLVDSREGAWGATNASGPAFVGVALLVLSFSFDGHTVTEGNRWLTGTLAIAHVGGAAVWSGGAVMLAAILWRRHRQERELRALQLALRFSVIATIAVGAVGVAGAALAATILDSPSELWTTPWGRLLIVKSFVVGSAMLLGGYNHKVLIPALGDERTTAAAGRKLRWIVRVEAGLLVAAILVTAALVGAGS